MNFSLIVGLEILTINHFITLQNMEIESLQAQKLNPIYFMPKKSRINQENFVQLEKKTIFSFL